MPWGSSIYAKVIAINLYGPSIESSVGNGAIILTVPDAPLNLIDDVENTDSTQISLDWDEGLADGGTPVIDYTLWYDQGGNTYVILASGILTTSYIATGLDSGTVYKFKVQARNAYGTSLDSNKVQILAAEVPY